MGLLRYNFFIVCEKGNLMTAFRKTTIILGLMFTSIGFAQAQPAPLVMDMTGTPALGEYVTIAFKDGETPVGEYFDIWICGEEAALAERRPDDEFESGPENDGCTPLNFWLREGVNPAPLAIKFLMTDEGYDPGEGEYAKVDVLNPLNDAVIASGDGGIEGADYCALTEALFDRNEQRIEPPYYLITHDYPLGGHSNFFGPLSCPAVSAIPTNSPKGLVVLAVLTLLASLLVFRARVS
jgi:hypothetical protein